MNPPEAILLAVSGLAAGAVNAVAGGGSLLSFPALLGIGLSPVPASITNTVGMLPGYAGSARAYRRELRSQGRRLTALGATTVVGSIGGAAALLAAPPGVFEAVVPVLVLGSSLLLVVQPRLRGWLLARAGGEHRERPLALHAAIGLGGAYGAYFGAALGVYLLAVLGLLLADGLQRLNAVKVALSLVSAVVATVLFALATEVFDAEVFDGSVEVSWVAAGVLAASSLAGGRLGGSLARRLPERALRAAVVVVGIGVAGALLL